MPPGQDDIFHFRPHGGRQDDIRVGGRIGDKVLRRNHEQVFPFQTPDDLVRFRRLGNRVGVPAHQGHNRRIQVHLSGKRPAYLQVVDDPRALRNKLRLRYHVQLVRMFPECHLVNTTTYLAPGASQGRQTTDGAYRLAPTPVSLHRNADTNGGRAVGGVFTRQGANIIGTDARDLSGPFRRTRLGPLCQFLIADGVVIHIILIKQVLFDNGMDHRHGQGAVSTGTYCYMPVGLPGGT